MKRLTALLLILCLLLCACAKKDSAETTEDTTVPTTEETKPAETKPTETEPTEPSVAELVNRHPLTGEVLNDPWMGQVVAVVVNNLRDAMPQCGISSADMYYEVEVESGITRCVALFTDLSDVKAIGPIRSARSAFNSIATSFDAPLVHCGGSDFALKAQYGDSSDQIKNWEHINEMENGSYFFRDKQRQKDGYAYEHTLFTTGELLQMVLDEKGMNTPTDKSFGMQFQENVKLNGEKAEEIVVTFKGTKTSKFIYDSASGLYKMFQHGKENIDGNTQEQVAFKNVIAIYTDQWMANDGVHVFYETIGSGDGYAAINGTIVPILWNRTDVYSPFTYTLADGTPLQLDVGTTYVGLVGIQNPISYK